MSKTWLSISIILWSACLSYAQTTGLSNLRHRNIATSQDSILLDSLTVLPATLRVSAFEEDPPLDTSRYMLIDNRLVWRPPVGRLPDSVTVSYRVLPYDLRQAFRRLDTIRLQTGGDSLLPALRYNPFADEAPLIDFRGLDYNGTFARGISFGNSQDLVLNSSFNLQLAGELGEGIEILAAISDENIPLQPEGNTQQLQEFDKIFIQLQKDNNRLRAGDYELARPDSYFMNYFKKLQGATFSNRSALGKGELTSNASIAIARGQFARNTINGLEGNQGPYKLRGMQGERFIIILSGTEKVWLDGQLLRRGLEQDYIIDYNRGELTFTNRRLINKDSRIIIEFEYSDQNYLRTLYAVNTEYRQERFRFYANLFNQQDSKNSTGNQELSPEERRILAAAGDDPSRAVASGVDTLEEFNALRAMYVWRDTLLPCGRRDTILTYSTDPAAARLTARFSFVGSGNGNYSLDNEQIANERVYRWIPPDPLTCSPRGDYAPVVQLTAPQQQALLTAGGEYRFSPTAALRTEVALSRFDRNRFSALDNDDDNGLALFTQFDKQFELDQEERWQLTTGLSYEFVQENFQALNPYRDPEFLRNWSLADKQGLGAVRPAREQLLGGRLALQHRELGRFEYDLSAFLRDSLYQGWRHFTRLQLRRGGLEIDGQHSWLTSAEPERRSRFLRPRLQVTQTLPWLGGWQVAAYGEMEKNDRYDTLVDTLSASSFYYHLLRTSFRSPAGAPHRLEATYSRREDFLPQGDGFRSSTLANEFNVNGSWQPGRALRLAGNLSYRQLQVDDPISAGRPPAATLLGRSDVGLNLFKGALRGNTTYELGSGQEPKLEFTFIRVNKGEGTHIWLDSLYNNDGVVQPNEMEIAPFPDQADFIRVTTVTDEFIQTDFVNFNQSVQLNPKAVWFNATGLRRFLARFSTQSSFKINRKTQEAPGVSAWNPFQLDIVDSALVALSSNVRNVLFFNRADPVYDIQLGTQRNGSKQVQTSGFESRALQESFLRLRWNLNQVLSTRLSLSTGRQQSDSEFFDAKDYRIDYYSLEPQLTILPVRTFRTVLSYQFRRDENTLHPDGERARQHDLKLETTFNQTSTSSIRLRASFVHIDFEGQANSPVGFAMLKGLAAGQNFLWELSFDRQLARSIQLRISYEGRKTGASRIVHVGRAQVAATF